jgi:RNA polymerase sigma factor (sigma-70 family)
VDRNLATWFAREILPYEAALMRYLARVCPKGDDIADLRQDVYVKAFEAATIERPVQVRSFLFTIARNLAIDRMRRNRIVSIEPTGDSEVLNVLIDELSPERRLNAHQELKVLGAAFRHLPTKCREVVWLRKVDDVPQAKVAELLGISVRTVEFHVQKGMRLLAQTLFGDGIGAAWNECDEADGSESEHGE